MQKVIRRLVFTGIDTSECFRDGRIMLKVVFRDEKGDLYVWVPRWEDVKNLYIEARIVESINTGKNPISFNENKDQVAICLAQTLVKRFAIKAIKRRLCRSKEECKNVKSEELLKRYFREAKTLDDFKHRVEEQLGFYNPDEEFQRELNNCLRQIGLKVSIEQGKFIVDYKYPIHMLSQE